MNTLSIDTTSEYLVLALSVGEKSLSGKVIKAGHNHSEILIPAVKGLIKSSGVTKESIKKISAVVGPGSFTGIRIGLAFARAFAMTMRAQVAPLTSFEVLAASAQPDKNSDGKMLILINALLPLVHWTVADIKTRRILAGYPPRIDRIEEVFEKITKRFKKSEITCFGGSAFLNDACLDVLKRNFFKNADDKKFLQAISCQKYIVTHPSPEALSRASWRACFYKDPAKLEPLYLKEIYLRK